MSVLYNDVVQKGQQPGMQQFWNWCRHYQEIYDWISLKYWINGLAHHLF